MEFAVVLAPLLHLSPIPVHTALISPLLRLCFYLLKVEQWRDRMNYSSAPPSHHSQSTGGGIKGCGLTGTDRVIGAAASFVNTADSVAPMWSELVMLHIVA